ncbi:MAG: hypothetical protein EPN91_05830 [Salinibacterium sp.]|nr:MAG: hypothetical protein EPN91_05830 [Salinibacterium sp.]
MISVILDAIYLITLGTWLASRFNLGSKLVLTDPVLVGMLALGLAVIFPAICAYVAYGETRWTKATSARVRRFVSPLVKNLRPNTQYNATPTAWDWIAGQQGDKWVRVLNDQGHWIGGWFSDRAFFSVYPEPRDLFIPIQWTMEVDGSFGKPVPNSAGVWVSLRNAQVVEWIDSHPTDGSKDQ